MKYGMRLRGFSMGAQPMDGLLSRQDDPSGKYYDILEYSRELTKEEIETYSLDLIQDTQPKKKLADNPANILQHQVEKAYELINNRDNPFNEIKAHAIAEMVLTTIKDLGYNSPEEMGVEMEPADFGL